MLPEISIRSHSSDQFVLDRVLYSNLYRLNRFIPNSTVVDVGAHIGSFSIASALNGASKIYSFEPSQLNYSVLIRNLANFSKDFLCFQLGVDVLSGFKHIGKPKMISSAFFELADVSIKPSQDVEEGESCFFVKLSEILKSVKEDIYLLKVSAPNMELEILNSCESLSLVENLCFETNCEESEANAILESLKNKGPFKNGLFEKVGQKTFLFLLSKEDLSICFSKYRST